MLQPRKVYKLDIPWYRKYLNRLGYTGRIYFYLVSAIGVVTSPIIYNGIVNGCLEEARSKWIVDEVMDLNNKTYSSLDEEDPSKPLSVKVYHEKFREDFLKKYTNPH